MLLKKALLAAVAICSLTAANAQDKIIKKNGDEIRVKIKEIGPRTIKYRRYDNPDGPDFVIGRREIEYIHFENGTNEYMEEKRMHRVPKERGTIDRHYGKNIISVAPVQFTNTSILGLGLHYERILDKRGIFSIYIPLAYSYHNTNYYDYNIINGYTDENKRAFWAYPGVKFYPTGSNRKVSFAAGLSFVIGTGTVPVSQSIYDPNTQSYYTQHVDKNFFQFGMMGSGSLNVQPTPHVYLGVELGLGVPYIQNGYRGGYNNEPYNYGNDPLVQFNFKVGYRF